jgi:hypothetical protein
MKAYTYCALHKMGETEGIKKRIASRKKLYRAGNRMSNNDDNNRKKRNKWLHVNQT